MKNLVLCAFFATLLSTQNVCPMMNRIRVEKKLEELNEQNSAITATIEDCYVYKKVIVLSSFFSSITLGVKTRNYKAACIPPPHRFSGIALHTTHHQ